MKTRFILFSSYWLSLKQLRHTVTRLIPLLLVGSASLVFSACSSMSVAAWEKGNLAKPVMVRDTSAQHAGLEQHTYMSKEATEGGYSLGAGGCGCN